MILSVRRVALVLIPLLAGFGLLALAWSQLSNDRPVVLPPPFLSTQAHQPLLPNLPPATAAADAPIITIASQPYHHPSGAFAINYPDGWQIDEAEDTVQFTAPDEGMAQFSVTFANGEAAADSDFERDLRQTWGDLPAFAIQTLNSDQLPDHWSATFAFTQIEPPNQMPTSVTGYAIYWVRQNVRYTFVAVITQQSWAQLQPLIQSIANSLQTYPNAIIINSE